MKRYGEIGRILNGPHKYVLFVWKEEYDNIEVPWFDIKIFNKDVKKK